MADATLRMPELPDTITNAQVLAALDALGLPHNARTLTMDAYGVTLTLLAQDAEGHFVHAGDDAMCITVHLPYAQQRVDVSKSMTRDQADKLRQQPNHGRVV